jgi:hypothetical protein
LSLLDDHGRKKHQTSEDHAKTSEHKIPSLKLPFYPASKTCEQSPIPVVLVVGKLLVISQNGITKSMKNGKKVVVRRQ